jgi:predicted ATP-binding protein involved in virulence
MINFKSISYKNFQSVGNAGMKIDLDRSPTTLIGGPNGSGKCVDKNTKINVQSNNIITMDAFEKFLETFRK